MYNTGIFSKIGFEHWEVGFRKKQWAGKWAWYPPFRTLYEHEVQRCFKQRKQTLYFENTTEHVFSKRKGMWHHNLTFSNTLCTASARQFC